MRSSLALLLIAAFLVPAGCNREKKADPAPVVQVAPKKDAPKADGPKADGPKADAPKPEPEKFKKLGLISGVRRAANRTEVSNMLAQLKLATQSYKTERNDRYPASREELETYYEKSTAINEALKEGDIVYIWKAKKTEDPEKTILAYEGQPDGSGSRIVLMANGDIQVVSPEEFKTLAKMQSTK